MRAPSTVSGLVGALLVLTSCGGASPDPAGGPAAGSTPSPTQTAAPARTDGAGPTVHPPEGAYDLTLEQVSVVGHDGHDRVVLRFAGTGRPGWVARYVVRAVLEGSGDVVALDGDAILRLDVTGTPTRPAGTGVAVRSELGGDVVDVHAVGAVEGITTVFLGIRGGRTPVAVRALTDPSRLVVDLG